MPNDRDPHSDTDTSLPGWGATGPDVLEMAKGDAGLWLTGGASLLAWTAFALLLTS